MKPTREEVEKFKQIYRGRQELKEEISVLLEHLQRSELQNSSEDYADLLFYYDGAMNAWFVKPIDATEILGGR